MHTLLELAERCEKATGPDRELDAEIAVAVSGDEAALVVRPAKGSIFSHKPGWWADGNDSSHLAAEFTASLDAALTLVPEGWNWKAGKLTDGGFGLTFKGEGSGKVRFERYAETAALALCAAALRARAAQEVSA